MVIALVAILGVQTPSIGQNRSLPESHIDFVRAFFPRIREANNQIIEQRNDIVELRIKYLLFQELSEKDYEFLNGMAYRYRIKGYKLEKGKDEHELVSSIEKLLMHVDIIPEKLVLAQAILESGWGSSYQAEYNNNYFGIQCWSEGCGNRPLNDSTANFYYRTFPSSKASIDYYLWTLNTHFAYVNLREVRAEMRMCGMKPEPLVLAKGLSRYSEKGSVYIRMVRKILFDYLPKNLDSLVVAQQTAYH